MSYSRTCNPYFVKSLNLGTLTLNGSGEIEDAGMLELKNYLQKYGIDQNFANVLSEKVWVVDMQTLQTFLQDSFEIVENKLEFPKRQQKVLNEVEISNVTPFERYLWNQIVSKQTSTQNQENAKTFIKLASRIVYSQKTIFSTVAKP